MKNEKKNTYRAKHVKENSDSNSSAKSYKTEKPERTSKIELIDKAKDTGKADKTNKVEADQIDAEETKSVAKSTIAMTFATLASRITGLLRTWVMAFALGNTVITSAYQVANNMPNVIFDLVAGGLLGAAFIPVFMAEKKKHKEDAGMAFSCNILNLTIVVLGVLSLLATIFAPQVIATQTFTVSSTAQVTETAILFFRIFAIQILFYGISGVLTAYLNAQRVFFVPAFVPVLNNVVVIAAFLAYVFISPTDQQLALIILGVGTTLGVVVQCLSQIPSLIKNGFKWRPILTLRDPALIQAVKIAIPTFVYVLGMLAAFTCRNAFSLQVGDNGPSTILYAWMWYQLPYGVVAVSLQRAMFTEMSESFARKNMKRLRAEMKMGISTTLVLIIPLAVLMFVFASPLVSLFRAGQFNVKDVSFVAGILQAWVVSLPFYSVVMYLYNAFAAIRKFGTFATICCIGVAVQCCLYGILCSDNGILLWGIPVADFIYYFLCCVILIIVLQRKIGYFGVLNITWRAIRVLLASAVGGIIGYAVSLLLTPGQVSMLNGLIAICTGGIVGLIIIFLLCWLLRVPEISNIANGIKRRFKK